MTTGCAGVTAAMSGTRLGYFRKFGDAVKARQVAEDDVFGEFRRQLEAQRAEDEASG